MEVAFGIVVIVVSVGGAVLSMLAYLGVGHLYRQIGRMGSLSLDPGEVSDETREIVREEVRHALNTVGTKRRAAP
jgi:hypothetical protein